MEINDLLKIGFKEDPISLPNYRLNEVLKLQCSQRGGEPIRVYLYYDANGMYLCISKAMRNIIEVCELINILNENQNEPTADNRTGGKR